MRVLVVTLFVAVLSQSSTRLVLPRRLLESPHKLYFTGIGKGACSTVSRPETGAFVYTPPKDGVRGDSIVTVGGSSFAIQDIECDAEENGALVFDQNLKLLEHSTLTGFDDYARRFIGDVDPLSTSTLSVVGRSGKSGQSSAPSIPKCNIGSSASSAIQLRAIVMANVTQDYSLHDDFLGKEYDIEVGYLYALTEYVFSSNENAICLYAEDVNAFANPKRTKEQGNSFDSGGSGGLSKGQIGGIIAGLCGILVGIAVLLTGAHCWRRQASSRGTDPAIQSDEEDSDKT